MVLGRDIVGKIFSSSRVTVGHKSTIPGQLEHSIIKKNTPLPQGNHDAYGFEPQAAVSCGRCHTSSHYTSHWITFLFLGEHFGLAETVQEQRRPMARSSLATKFPNQDPVGGWILHFH